MEDTEYGPDNVIEEIDHPTGAEWFVSVFKMVSDSDKNAIYFWRILTKVVFIQPFSHYISQPPIGQRCSQSRGGRPRRQDEELQDLRRPRRG